MKSLTGKVISKTEKTAIVEVVNFHKHRVYEKRIKVTKHYPSHDEIDVSIGQSVEIQETRPISKTKKWKVTKILQKGSGIKTKIKKGAK